MTLTGVTFFGGVAANSSPFSVRVASYVGDGLATLSDFTASGGSALSPLTVGYSNIGTTYRFDVTGLYNAAAARGDVALGVRLDQTATPNMFATFDGFVLDWAVTAVPEPGMVALMVGGLSLLGAVGRRRR